MSGCNASLVSCLICLLALQSGKASAADDTIIFPDGVSKKINGGKQCDLTFCEEVGEYPVNDIDAMINRNSFLTKYLSVDESPVISISDRAQFDTGTDETLCQSRVKVYYPRVGINTNNTERFIVNTAKYKQTVSTEVCVPNTKCKYSDGFPNGYESSCKQKYTRKRLLSVNSKSKEPTFDFFDIPCCCVCSLKRVNV